MVATTCGSSRQTGRFAPPFWKLLLATCIVGCFGGARLLASHEGIENSTPVMDRDFSATQSSRDAVGRACFGDQAATFREIEPTRHRGGLVLPKPRRGSDVPAHNWAGGGRPRQIVPAPPQFYPGAPIQHP